MSDLKSFLFLLFIFFGFANQTYAYNLGNISKDVFKYKILPYIAKESDLRDILKNFSLAGRDGYRCAREWATERGFSRNFPMGEIGLVSAAKNDVLLLLEGFVQNLEEYSKKDLCTAYVFLQEHMFKKQKNKNLNDKQRTRYEDVLSVLKKEAFVRLAKSGEIDEAVWGNGIFTVAAFHQCLHVLDHLFLQGETHSWCFPIFKIPLLWSRAAYRGDIQTMQFLIGKGRLLYERARREELGESLTDRDREEQEKVKIILKNIKILEALAIVAKNVGDNEIKEKLALLVTQLLGQLEGGSQGVLRYMKGIPSFLKDE